MKKIIIISIISIIFILSVLSYITIAKRAEIYTKLFDREVTWSEAFWL